jgi:hypothetical protein
MTQTETTPSTKPNLIGLEPKAAAQIHAQAFLWGAIDAKANRQRRTEREVKDHLVSACTAGQATNLHAAYVAGYNHHIWSPPVTKAPPKDAGAPAEPLPDLEQLMGELA